MSIEVLHPRWAKTLALYKRNARHDSQDDSIPQLFKDAMAVREEVFVDEQHCSLENEVDDDDARSWHWVVYVSIASNSNGNSNQQRDPSIPTAVLKPVGTLRLVPPPHGPHPTDDDDFQPEPAYHEPYVKLTRLAVVKEYRRKFGIARLLLSECYKFIMGNAAKIYRPLGPASLEKLRIKGDLSGMDEFWNGLMLVHAQVQASGFWDKMGFVKDEGLGEWDEEGIEHIGMWKKLILPGDNRLSRLRLR